MNKKNLQKADKNVLLEVWKTWNYCYAISLPIFLILLTLLWYLDYKVGFFILAIALVISHIGTGWRISKIERRLM